ncbi:multiple inositol polyphosphate phosphatase 1-like isoform X2 [Phymastichus coffea]|uniref:multiple inositol polyphosphate phosphatase 1-like isoform X2 n=1 Tax=Phymastichus coffea TaxID=108790 RepID=UPI00273CEBD4|nr:multiple inositol polyphosphate phosphatase 1-like isoform X2 [Phymastichus coffea]
MVILNWCILSILYCLLVYLWSIEGKSVNIDDCYNSTRDFYPYLASRTPYEFVHGEIERVAGCTPLQIWMTARHGTRYPDKLSKQHMLDLESFRDQIVANHQHGRGQLCPKDLTDLRLWQPDPNFYEKNGTLGEAGKNELHLLAKRLEDAFPEILDSNDPTDYNFAASKRASATSSLLSFANALLDTNATVNFDGEKLKEDQDCDRWKKEYKHEVQMTEYRRFATGPVMHRTLNEVSQRLGFTEKVGFVSVMYDVCRFETALDAGKISKWCTVFSKENLMVFEYLSDLDYYYCCGPGNTLSRKLNCNILKKLFKAFEQLENRNIENQPKGTFNFGHSSNIQSVMTLLKVFDHEQPLLASNYESMKSRLYNTTFMNAFTSNIVAVFYRCDNITMPNQVQFHIAENPVEIPGCEGPSCDWDYLKREFQPMLDQCDANFCDVMQNDTTTSASDTFINRHIGNPLPIIFITFSFYTYIFE